MLSAERLARGQRAPKIQHCGVPGGRVQRGNGFGSDGVTLFQFGWVGYGYGGPCL
jgi:hypothetical protein